MVSSISREYVNMCLTGLPFRFRWALNQVFSSRLRLHSHHSKLSSPKSEANIQTFLCICKVVSKLHEEGCSNRALTPDSIILLGGDKHRPVLQDFGLAAHTARSGGTESVLIQAPEQRYSTPELALPGPRTDIYQLGAILSTLITGQPFSVTESGISAGVASPNVH